MIYLHKNSLYFCINMVSLLYSYIMISPKFLFLPSVIVDMINEWYQSMKQYGRRQI